MNYIYYVKLTAIIVIDYNNKKKKERLQETTKIGQIKDVNRKLQRVIRITSILQNFGPDPNFQCPFVLTQNAKFYVLNVNLSFEKIDAMSTTRSIDQTDIICGLKAAVTALEWLIFDILLYLYLSSSV